ncbi:hypothetical protein GQ457_02G012530 [Hibiscus cannabinus]
MGKMKEGVQAFVNNRWLVFVAAMWIQSCAGIGYVFGSISPVIKSSLNYNQRQLSKLGVAKDLGDSVGFLAGSLSEILPLWGALLVGALQNLVGYGWVWLIVTGRAPVLPLWAMCILIFVGTNGETYFNTAALVSCVQNFPKSRGPVVGILKGFAGLSGAILTQCVPPIGSLLDGGDAFGRSCRFIPIKLSFCDEPRDVVEEALLPKPEQQATEKSEQDEVIFSEVEDEKPKDVDLLPASERHKRIAQLQAKLCQAAAEGAVRVKRRRGPHRGEDFTMMEALIKADLWLIFFSLLLGSGSGLTVIDNLGQMSQSLGYDNTHIFVSMISIWNFLGRVGGGYLSEIIVRDYAYPRPISLAVAQIVMAVGHVFFAMGWPGAMHIGTLLIGLGYGAHWAIVPAAASELFGLKKFGALYNFLTLANPAGSLVFSGVIASGIYDREAEKQAHQRHISTQISGSILSGMFAVEEPLKCEGSICFFLTSMIMSGFCIIAAVLSLILVYRTKTVYANIYGKSRT